MNVRVPKTASERSLIRLTLFVGFALIFLLWLATGYDVIRYIGTVQSRTVRINDWYLRTEELLDDVRTGVLLASVSVRDGVLDTEAKNDDYYRGEVAHARAKVSASLNRYESWVHSAEERADFAELRRNVEEMWAATGPILVLDEQGRAKEAIDALRSQLGPRHDAINRISAQIERLNQGAAADQRNQVVAAYRAMERRMWAVGSLALALSGLVGFIITRGADRMERQVRSETARNVENVKALQRLSDRLVRAEEEERRTISRELHDEVGQSLTAIKMELARLGTGGDEGTARTVSTLRDMTEKTLNDVRQLSRLLHPMVLEDFGLPTAVEWYLKEFGERSGLAVDFMHVGLDDRLAPAIETCIYRIVQEASRNVVRHAEARTCRVTLQRVAALVTLIVEDDGRGFEDMAKPPAPPRGLGLVGIRERVTGFGGSLSIDSRPGRGTRLIIDLPTRLPGQPNESAA